jgi:phosphotriesterase-related protein
MIDPIVRTAAGDVVPAELGLTDYHEHLLMRSPLLPGDELDDVARSSDEARLLHEAGIDAVVELTPLGLGRDPEGLARIAQDSGLHVVVATGVHREAHYPAGHWVRDAGEEALADRFTREVLDGCVATEEPDATGPTSTVRAGVIKCGTGYWSIAPLERTVLAAAVETHHRTGVAIVCHLEMGTAAHEVVELLTLDGVTSDAIALAHADRNPDPGLHCELTSAGVYLGYDGIARAKHWPDSTILDCLIATAERGRSDRLLLGGDVARRTSFRSYGGLPGLDYLPRVFAPRLAAAGGEELLERILVGNPAAFLSFTPPR